MFTCAARGDRDSSSSIVKSDSENVILTVLNMVCSLAALHLLFTKENDLSVGPPKLAAINSSISKGRSVRFAMFEGCPG
jgi:hypothetical protein